MARQSVKKPPVKSRKIDTNDAFQNPDLALLGNPKSFIDDMLINDAKEISQSPRGALPLAIEGDTGHEHAFLMLPIPQDSASRRMADGQDDVEIAYLTNQQCERVAVAIEKCFKQKHPGMNIKMECTQEAGKNYYGIEIHADPSDRVKFVDEELRSFSTTLIEIADTAKKMYAAKNREALGV